jgi:hypothetical protein
MTVISKDNLTLLELNILAVAKYYQNFQYIYLFTQTISANKEEKEKAIDNLISKGYFIYCSNFGVRLTLKGIDTL